MKRMTAVRIKVMPCVNREHTQYPPKGFRIIEPDCASFVLLTQNNPLMNEAYPKPLRIVVNDQISEQLARTTKIMQSIGVPASHAARVLAQVPQHSFFAKRDGE